MFLYISNQKLVFSAKKILSMLVYMVWQADPLLLCEVVTYLLQECNIETACQAESGIR